MPVYFKFFFYQLNTAICVFTKQSTDDCRQSNVSSASRDVDPGWKYSNIMVNYRIISLYSFTIRNLFCLPLLACIFQREKEMHVSFCYLLLVG